MSFEGEQAFLVTSTFLLLFHTDLMPLQVEQNTGLCKTEQQFAQSHSKKDPTLQNMSMLH